MSIPGGPSVPDRSTPEPALSALAPARGADDWSAAHLLAEPTRRQVFDAVRAADRPLTRDDVAATTQVNRRLVTFHLDRLAEAGLLEVDYARPTGRRGGPGAGRPAKRYRVVDVQIDLTLPPRRFDLVARILALAVAEAPGDAAARAGDVALAEGERIGRSSVAAPPGPGGSAAATLGSVAAALADLGYEPVVTERLVRLRNCPFHGVVDVATELVCGINERLVCGLLAGLGGHPSVRAALDGAPGDCCVTVAVEE